MLLYSQTVNKSRLLILIIPAIALVLGYLSTSLVLNILWHRDNTGIVTPTANQIIHASSSDYLASNTPEKVEVQQPTSKDDAEVISEYGNTESGKIIIANLDSMEIALIENGITKSKLPILTKGKPGSYYETPGGDYKVESKEDVKLSSLGNVYMPYAMQFFGNYFIHGIPYYKDGKKVSSSYSGGCIRLLDTDAKQVYDFASVGDTKVHITNNSYYSSSTVDSQYYIAQSDGLSLTASQAIAMDLSSGQILLEYNGNQIIPMEGNSKLLAANVSLDVVNQEKIITYKNNKIQVKDLLPLILTNADEDAMDTVIKQYGSSNFIKKMNTKAAAIKLTNTYIVEPSGLSEKTVSTVYDIAKLIKYTNDFKPFLLAISSATTTSSSTLNIFAGKEGYYGGSYGFLPTQYHSIAGVFDIEPKANLVDIINGASNNMGIATSTKVKVVLVISGSINPEADINNLLEYLNKSAMAK